VAHIFICFIVCAITALLLYQKGFCLSTSRRKFQRKKLPALRYRAVLCLKLNSAFDFCKKVVGAKQLCSDVVPVTGVEPVRYLYHRILSYITHSESETIKRTLSESVTLKKSPEIKGFRQLNVKNLVLPSFPATARFESKFEHRRSLRGTFG